MAEYKLTTEPFYSDVNCIDKYATYVTASGWLFHCTMDNDDNQGQYICGYGVLTNPLTGQYEGPDFTYRIDGEYCGRMGLPDADMRLVARVTNPTTEKEH